MPKMIYHLNVHIVAPNKQLCGDQDQEVMVHSVTAVVSNGSEVKF